MNGKRTARRRMQRASDPLIVAGPRAGQRINGRGDRIRTCDPLLPKQMRYQAALLPAFAKASSGQTRQSMLLLACQRLLQRSVGWWARRDSNPQPSRYERPALPLSYRPCPEAAAG